MQIYPVTQPIGRSINSMKTRAFSEKIIKLFLPFISCGCLHKLLTY